MGEKKTMLEAYERLAERDVTGGFAHEEVESEKARLLSDSEGREVAHKYEMDALYKTIPGAKGLRYTPIRLIAVMAGLFLAVGLVFLLFERGMQLLR